MGKNNIEKEITLEDLALMVGKGFNKMDERFERMDERFNKMDEKFEKLEKKLDKTDQKLDDLKLEVMHRRVHIFDHNDLEHRVEKPEDKVEKLRVVGAGA
jgi:Skp family chaperone for outer membrane proteins